VSGKLKLVTGAALQTEAGGNSADPDQLHEAALKEHAARQRRREIFPETLFGEAGWEMLIWLLILELEGERASVRVLLEGTAAPSTTALRHIEALRQHGLIQDDAPDHDKRKRWIRLTQAGRAKLASYLLTSEVN
jgi:DNA-binding MarR family transcriptional regulator